MGDDGQPTIVEPVWLENNGGGPEAPEIAAGTAEPRWWIGLLAVVVSGVIAASWASAGSTPAETAAPTTSESPTTTTSAAPTTTVASTSTTTTAAPDPNRQQLTSEISFPVGFEGGWLALRIGSRESDLAWSADGFQWSEFETDLPPGHPVALHRTNDSVVLVMTEVEIGSGTAANNLQFWSSPDATDWVLAAEAASSNVGFAPRRSAASDDRVLLVERDVDSGARLPGLSDVMAEYVDATDAARVCRVVDSTDTLESIYELVDCDGMPVAEVTLGGDTALDRNQRDCLGFLSFATAAADVVTIVDASGTVVQVSLEPYLFVADTAMTPEGFAISALDVRDFGPPAGPCQQFGPGGETGLLAWTSTSGLTSVGPPVDLDQQQIGVELVTLQDGRLLAARSDGAYVASEPYVEWALLAEPPSSGGFMTASADGRVLLYTEPSEFSVRAWIAPVGGEWIALETLGQGGFEPMLGTDDYAVVGIFGRRGFELLRVEY